MHADWIISRFVSEMVSTVLNLVVVLRQSTETRYFYLLFIYFLRLVSDKIVEGLNACSPDTFRVVDAIVDALTSQRPQTRYAVGWDAKLMIFISFLPTFIADRFLKK